MASTPRLVLAVAALAGAAACGTTSTTPPQSCSHGADYCYDFPANTSAAQALQACVGVGGVGGQYVPTSCTPVNLTGTCSGSANALIVGTLIRYYAPFFDVTRAAEACAMAGGLFTAN